MRVIRWILLLICTTAFVIVGIYSFLALIIAAFILTGTLTPGGTMFFDSATPTLIQALIFAGIGATIAIGLAFTRRKLLRLSRDRLQPMGRA